jgi:hypothetical protein
MVQDLRSRYGKTNRVSALGRKGRQGIRVLESYGISPMVATSSS